MGVWWKYYSSPVSQENHRDREEIKISIVKAIINIFSHYHIFYSVCRVGIFIFQSSLNLHYLVTFPCGILKSFCTLGENDEGASVCYLWGQSCRMWVLFRLRCLRFYLFTCIICNLEPVLWLGLKFQKQSELWRREVWPEAHPPLSCLSSMMKLSSPLWPTPLCLTALSVPCLASPLTGFSSPLLGKE